MAKSLYRILVPIGSRRDRFAWITMVTVKKLREGPGPWLRAVRKGVYQLLPPGVQQRLLRWTGQAEFFRRSTVRHAAADAGVEQPGLVSIVLPVFDQASLVAESIDSVLAQSHAPIELILVDDGSSDGVERVLQRYLDDPRVRVLTQPNQGLPKALSTGFEAATGEFFTWTSADNLMHAQQLTRLVAFLREHADVAMVYADYELIDANGAPLVGGEFRVMDRTDKRNLSAVRVNRHTHDLNRYEDNFIGACFLYRGQVGRLLGDYNPEIGLEDYDYWMRINRLFRIEHLGTDEILYRYRVHDNTLSARARELKILERARVLMDYERRRAEWQRAPLRVLADDSSMQWLRACVPPPDTLVSVPAEGVPEDGKKTLVVVRGEHLALPALAELPANAGLAAFFASVASVHEAHAALRPFTGIAFASDTDVAARLAVFSRSVFVARPGPEALALAVRHCVNATFFRSTRDRDVLHRAVPLPLAGPSPLRVLLQVQSFGSGGLERVVEDLAVSLRDLGCEVGLLAIDESLGTSTRAIPDGVEAVHLGRRDVAAYSRLLRDGRWQVVSAHASVFGAEQAAALQVPFVQTVHNSYVWYDRDQVASVRVADAATSAYACVSAQALGYLDLRLQLDVQKALVLENGIDLTERAVTSEARLAELRAELDVGAADFVFLQVASLQPAKAHRIAVHALARLRERHPAARLVCLGNEMNPPYAALVRRDVERLGLANAVVFAGHRPDPWPFYDLADAFLLPSYWEGCSLAVWEAMRAGLPLVLSDVGAAREQLRWAQGALVQPPFDSMFDLDSTNVDALVAAVQPDFVDRTAAAMAALMTAPRDARRRTVALPPVADRQTMARRYLILFRWLKQGGSVRGVRELLARAARDRADRPFLAIERSGPIRPTE